MQVIICLNGIKPIRADKWLLEYGIILRDHAVDLVGHDTGKLIVVSGVVAVDRDVYAAQVGGLVVIGRIVVGGASAGHARKGRFREPEHGQVDPRELEILQHPKAEQVILLIPHTRHLLPDLGCQRLHTVDDRAGILSDTAFQQLHEVGHIGVGIGKRAFIRHREM